MSSRVSAPPRARDGLCSAMRTAVLIAAAFGLAACGGANAINPFSGGDDEDEAPQERISFLTFDQRLEITPELAGAEISLPGDYVNVAWPNEGGYANHAVQHPRLGEELRRAWRRDIGEGSSRRTRVSATPIVADDKIFVVDGEGRVSAYAEEDGDRLWRRRLRAESRRDREGRGGGLTFAGGTLFATSGFAFIEAMDADTGEQLWRRRTSGPMHAAPTFHDGRVFAVSVDNELYALDASDGAVLWTYQSLAEPARILTSSSPAATGDVVIAPFASGEVVALRAQNGRVNWTEALTRTGGATPLSALNDIAGSPVVVDGVVYAVSHSGVLAAHDLASGERIWARPAGGIHMPWVVGDYLFVITVDSELACISRRTGDVFWLSRLPQYKNEKRRRGRIAWAGPVLAGGRLILVSSEGRSVEVDPGTGEILNDRKVGDKVFIPPVVANESLYFLTDEAKLVAFR